MNYRRVVLPGATYFFTVVTQSRRKFLCHDDHPALLKAAMHEVASEHPFTIDAFVLLPDHLHCIWSLPENDSDYSTRWRLIKSYFTRHCDIPAKKLQTSSRIQKGEKGIWQRRFWEHCIRDDADFNRHMEYIHYNPVKHGYVHAPIEWQWSSFHHYVRQGWYEPEWGAVDEMVFDDRIGFE